MKCMICVLTVMCILLVSAAGCGGKAVDPSLYFENYSRLTDLYGTGRMQTPAALGFDLQAVENISDSCWGFPITETYAGVTFEINTIFSGPEYFFSGVQMERVYAYPEEEAQLLQDTVAVCLQLVEDFGTATDTSYFFNWVEGMMGEKWNEDIRYWQDPSVLKRVADEGFYGNLLVWDLTSAASPEIKAFLKSNGRNPVHMLGCNLAIYESDGTAVLTVSY